MTNQGTAGFPAAAQAAPNKTPMALGGSGLWYEPPVAAVTNALLTQAEEWFTPVYFDRATQLASIGLEVTTVGSTGPPAALVRLGIRSDYGDGRPYRLLFDAGTIDGTSQTVQTVSASATWVGPGWVWFTATGQASPSVQATVRACNGNAGLAIGTTSALASPNSLGGYKWGSAATGALAMYVTLSSLVAKVTVPRMIWQPT